MGAMCSGESLANISSGIKPSVIREAAMGTITLEWMLYLAPSWLSVLLSPTRPSLAAL